MGSGPVKVSQAVRDGIMEIRESGLTNMFDYHMVMRIANDRQMYELVSWMADHKAEYGQIIFKGMEVTSE